MCIDCLERILYEEFSNEIPYLRESSVYPFRGFLGPKTGCALESMVH